MMSFPKSGISSGPIEAFCAFLNRIASNPRGILRRLFSTFATGGPGLGLLLMRLTSGISLIAQGLTRLRTEPMVLDVLTLGVAMLLLAGLWTPIAGWLAAIVGLWKAFSHIGDPWANILLATLGVSLALLGPGVWSVDARLFGWKRIDVRSR